MKIPFLTQNGAPANAPQAVEPGADKSRYEGTLIARGLTKTYGTRRVVNGASLVVDTLGFGRVKTDKPKAFVRNGGAATLGIRPERLRVLWDDETSEFEVAGEVVERHYFGEVTHLIVRIPGFEAPLSVIETNDFGADDLPIGETIRIAYDPEALVAMAD